MFLILAQLVMILIVVFCLLFERPIQTDNHLANLIQDWEHKSNEIVQKRVENFVGHQEPL